MNYLKISNEGLLDIRLVYLMGGTTKADNEFKIGQFGTGLKYTVAYLLRNNIDFKLFIDEKPIKFKTSKERIRDTDFEVIHINKDRSSITTNMGYDWEAWMIIRELWCNALDEQDPKYEIVDEVTPVKGRTEYYIQLVPDIKKVYDDWNKYFIHDIEPLQYEAKFAIYPGGGSLRCYKNGVLINEDKDKKSVFAYDIKNTQLNELREMKYSPDTEIRDIIPELSAKNVEIFLENVNDKYEEKLDYYSWNKFGEGWKKKIGNAKFCTQKIYDKIVDRVPDLANQAIVIVPSMLYHTLVKQFPFISITRASDKLNEFYETFSQDLYDRIIECKELLEKVGYFIDPNLKILIGVFGNKDVLAEVHMDSKEIRISQDLEQKSDHDIIICLIEENEHFKTGLSDCTRGFQSHFIDLYANLLLKPIKTLI